MVWILSSPVPHLWSLVASASSDLLFSSASRACSQLLNLFWQAIFITNLSFSTQLLQLDGSGANQSASFFASIPDLQAKISSTLSGLQHIRTFSNWNSCSEDVKTWPSWVPQEHPSGHTCKLERGFKLPWNASVDCCTSRGALAGHYSAEALCPVCWHLEHFKYRISLITQAL